MSYSEELTKAMTWLGEQPDAVFVGQSIAYTGNAMYKTLSGVPMNKRIELPVAEEMQMGISLGMSLTGKTVISIYPRMDFLLLAVNQLVNHLDKLEEFTHSEYHAKVIIRVGIGATKPMYPGIQHCGDYTLPLRNILRNVRVWRLGRAEEISRIYTNAYCCSWSSLIIEDMNNYNV